MRHAGERLRREAPVLLWCLATTLVAFRGFFFGGEVLFFRDLVFVYAPMKKVIAQALAAGEWPSWNPYVLGGVPLLTEVYSAPLYPANLLFLLPFDFGRLLSLSIIVHYPLALLACYAFLRGEGLGRFPATTGATAFAWSGMILSESSFFHQLTVSVWGPLLLWAAGRDRRSLPGGVLAWALAVSGGAFERLLLLGPLTLSYALLRRGREGVLHAFIALLLGTAIAGPCWMPILACVSETSSRTGGLGWTRATRESLGPARWEGLFTPFSFIDDKWDAPATDSFASGLSLHGSLYLGASTLLLAALAFHSPRRRAMGFWGGALLIGLLLAGGAHSPFYRIAWDYFPPIRLFRFPVKFLWLSSLALAVFAAYGCEVLFDPRATARRTLVAALGAYFLAIPAVVFLAGRLRDPLAPFLALHIMSAALHGGLAALATTLVVALARRRPHAWLLLPVLLFIDLLGSGGRFAPTTSREIYAPPPTAAWVGGERYITSNDAPPTETDPRKLADVAWQTDPLRIALTPNAGSIWGLRSIEGMSLLRSNRELSDFLRPKPGENDGGARAYGFLGVRWLVVSLAGTQPPLPWRLVRRDEERSLSLYENPLYLPRARLYGTTGRAEILEDGLARQSVRVEADSPGLLLLADSWDPGWSAFRGDDEVAVERVGGFLRGVRVPAGPSRIRFEYRAPGLIDGLFLSGAGIILLGLLAMGRGREIG